MPSPICTVNGNATTGGVDVSAGVTVTIALDDVSGVDTWSITCIGRDDVASDPTITVNTVNKTATFLSGSSGSAYVFQSTVNNGMTNGVADGSLTTTFTVHVKTVSGYRVLAYNETTESNATAGWVAQVNAIIRARRSQVIELTTTGGVGAERMSAHCDATGGAFSVSLPASPTKGDRYTVIKIDSSANAVTVDGNGKNIAVAGIGSAATFALSNQWETLTVEATASAWVAI